eukprot:Tamp_15815.p1 GENE.Tamp_15815~~Tamp_15815.p1  ORF type:complete len:114 (+),score=20.35 Tamp_15815:504-845(+)
MCSHTHAACVRGLAAERDRLQKQRNKVAHEKAVLQAWDAASSRACLVCSRKVVKSGDEESRMGGINCPGCGRKPGCHKARCSSYHTLQTLFPALHTEMSQILHFVLTNVGLRR